MLDYPYTPVTEENMIEPILIIFLTLLTAADKAVHSEVDLDPSQRFERREREGLPPETAGEEAFNRAVERAQEVGDSSWTDWAVKLLVIGEGAVIFWLYKLIKSEEKQRQILEGVTSFWGKESVEESTHRRLAMLLNAIGEEVLYVAQGDLKSVLKLSNDRRLLLFFRDSKEEDLYFVETIDDFNVFVQNSAKERVLIPIEEFFKKKKFSFIVFLSEKNFCGACRFNPLKTEIQGEIE